MLGNWRQEQDIWQRHLLSLPLKVDGQKVDIAYYEGEAAWNAVNEGKEATPSKTETLDMGQALKVPTVGI